MLTFKRITLHYNIIYIKSYEKLFHRFIERMIIFCAQTRIQYEYKISASMYQKCSKIQQEKPWKISSEKSKTRPKSHRFFRCPNKRPRNLHLTCCPTCKSLGKHQIKLCNIMFEGRLVESENRASLRGRNL